MIPGSVYDRSGAGQQNHYNNPLNMTGGQPHPHSHPAYYRPHDQLSYISQDRAQTNALTNLPVPLGMFMNMTHIPPRFYNQPNMSAPVRQPPITGQRNKGNIHRNTNRISSTNRRPNKSDDFPTSQPASQDTSLGGSSLSQGPLTQGQLSMSQMSQPAFASLSQPGLSQPGLSQVCLSQTELSQDPYSVDDLRSQAEGMLSQESSYQTDRNAFLMASQMG
ncbi:unnamed protein product, partial [Medioppia subpectinata]